KITTVDAYHGVFSRQDADVLLDASVLCLYSRTAPQLIHAYNEKAKILILLRSPPEFLFSYYHRLRLVMLEDQADFSRAWDLQQQRAIGEQIPRYCHEPALLQYARIARFGEQLERYLALFPASQVRVIVMEEWIRNPRQTYLGILEFLGLQ